MRITMLAALLIAVGTGQVFDVVSIKLHTGTALSSISERPDGSVTLVNVAMTTLLTRAYPPAIPGEMLGLPDTIGNLVTFVRVAAGRPIVDKTGLTGSYRVKLTFDRLIGGRGPEVAPANDAAPSIFTAVQEQLGMKLEPAKIAAERLVIDRLERPTEN